MARGTVERWLLAALPALAVAGPLAGCGSGANKVPSLASVPLAPGTRVVAQQRSCDRGAGAYCAIAFVVVGDGYANSDALMRTQGRHLHDRGWTGAAADTGDERAAESPGHKLRLTYATAYGDAKGIGEQWIKRPRTIGLTLSQLLFARRSALSMLLEEGPG